VANECITARGPPAFPAAKGVEPREPVALTYAICKDASAGIVFAP
jgi:hypothetical protein